MKIKILVIMLTLGVVAASCDLNETPYGFYSDENFYKTQEDAEAALMYAYNAFTFIEYTRGIINIGDLPTETTNLKPDEGQDAQELNNWTAGSTNETLMNFFKYCYISINRANVVIEQVSASNFPQSFKDRVVGEALVLKSWSYFNLVRVFGLVPIQNESVRTVEQTRPPLAQSMDALYNILLADLMRAEAKLEVNKRVGRVDKVAAQAILAKAYLTIASSKENGVPLYSDMQRDVATMYDSAAFWAHKVLYDQNAYALDPDLKNIYDVYAPDGPEHIFILSHDRTGEFEGNYSKTPLMFMPWVDGAPYYLRFSDGSLVYTTNGWEVYRVDQDFIDSYETIDKRRTELIHSAVFDAQGNEVGSVAGGQIPGPFCVKYLDPEFVGQKTSARPFLIRTSDIALTYAEAVGPTANGYFWVNEVRSRAGIANLQPGLNLVDFRQAVLRERRWEFAFEGHYLYDLRRTASVTTNVAAARLAGLTEADAAFYPLPQQELDLNTSIPR